MKPTVIDNYDEFDLSNKKAKSLIHVLKQQNDDCQDIEKTVWVYEMIDDLLQKQRECFDNYYKKLNCNENQKQEL